MSFDIPRRPVTDAMPDGRSLVHDIPVGAELAREAESRLCLTRRIVSFAGKPRSNRRRQPRSNGRRKLCTNGYTISL
jgi:hypothetical protein